MILAELSNKKSQLLKKISSNFKDIKQAQAYATAYPSAAAGKFT